MKKCFVALVILMCFVVSAEAMDLNESINSAIKNNPTVIASQKSAAAANARLNQAFSAFFPTVNLNGHLNSAYSSPATVQIKTAGVTQNVTFGTDATANVTGLQAGLSQPVFVPALYPGYGIAKKGADSANEQYQQTVVDTTFNVSQAYFGVLKSIKLEKLMRDAVTMARSHREQIESMLKAGMSTKADLLRTKVQEADDTVNWIQSKYRIDISKDTFNNALGNDMKQPVDLKDEGFTGKVDNLPEYDLLLETAFNNRPDWKMYLLTTGISEDQVKLSQSEYLPNVLLTANSGSQLTKYPTFQSDVSSWNVMGSASWTLFDSLARENRISEANENLSAQKANLKQFSDNVALQVHTAYLTLKSALDVVVATQQEVDSATESYSVANSRYNSGTGTNVDVLDAEVDLTQAWMDNLDALFNVEISKAKINKVVGKKIF
ncbi:MAG: TolC family protein [Candidatus Saganbacteria bacterium]|nr:TolC family protein [Candidatus Saganbacteria bacterium]